MMYSQLHGAVTHTRKGRNTHTQGHPYIIIFISAGSWSHTGAQLALPSHHRVFENVAGRPPERSSPSARVLLSFSSSKWSQVHLRLKMHLLSPLPQRATHQTTTQQVMTAKRSRRLVKSKSSKLPQQRVHQAFYLFRTLILQPQTLGFLQIQLSLKIVTTTSS